jgi:pilus assembly protein Flp/PilA
LSYRSPPRPAYEWFAKGTYLLIPATHLRRALLDFAGDETGQDLIEYALVAGIIGLGAVVAMSGLSTKIRAAFNTLGNSLSNAI